MVCLWSSLKFNGFQGLNASADKEIEIIHHLAQRVLAHQDLIKTCSDICGELDRCDGRHESGALLMSCSLCALVQGAKTYNLVRPTITEENIIRIKGGR